VLLAGFPGAAPSTASPSWPRRCSSASTATLRRQVLRPPRGAAHIAASLPSLEHVVYLPYLNPDDDALPLPNAVHWQTLLGRGAVTAAQFQYAQVPFDHPLWTLFSSGTTGLPKPIVHGHGGILLEILKNGTFHFDLHPGGRVFYFTTTGWMLWNFLTGTPLTGAVPVLYDGHPAYPTPDVLWKMADEAGVVTFGASPTYVDQLSRSGIVPRERYKLSALRTVNLAGSPATPESMAWFYRNVKQDLWVANGSGGTDCCTGFVGGVPTLPVRAGELQARCLGASVEAWDEDGCPLIDEVGELVITKPMPSMPVRFLNDPGDRATARPTSRNIRASGHGDFFRSTPRAAPSCWALDATQPLRHPHGHGEIYRTLGPLPQVRMR
jgi:acetoacetyl-CoA synthetase